MAYADFNYYQTFYVGTIIPEESTFRQAAERASDYLDSATFGRLYDGLPVSDEEPVRKCCCALAEAIYSFGLRNEEASGHAGARKTQETIGAYSVSFASAGSTLSALLHGGESGLEDYLHSICLRYLGRTGLLFRGVC